MYWDPKTWFPKPSPAQGNYQPASADHSQAAIQQTPTTLQTTKQSAAVLTACNVETRQQSVESKKAQGPAAAKALRQEPSQWCGHDPVKVRTIPKSASKS
jgi:hypothetical protein